MCENKKCPIKDTCYRWTALPSQFQSYSKFKYSKENGCEYFLPLKKEEWNPWKGKK